MERFVGAIEKALKDENWHAALGLALCMPDICRSLEVPGSRGRAKYAHWYDRYLLPKYTVDYGPVRTYGTITTGGVKVLMSGRDCYALRCAYLHEGTDSTELQDAREALNRFHFVYQSLDGYPPAHRNLINGDTLQLWVDAFCREMCEAIRQWAADVANDETIQKRISELLHVYPFGKGVVIGPGGIQRTR